MRISDWSSDVCSSDLFAGVVPNNDSNKASAGNQTRYSTILATIGFSTAFATPAACTGIAALKANIKRRNNTNPAVQKSTVRANSLLHGQSEGRRQGKECARTFKTRWSQTH